MGLEPLLRCDLSKCPGCSESYQHPECPKFVATENPKHAAGRAKQPFRHIPPIALAAEGRVMNLGADKYGGFNWGAAGVVASVYYDAMLRHLFAWYTGEDVDPESGESHLAHIRACAGILLDSQALKNLSDDRPLNRTAATGWQRSL